MTEIEISFYEPSSEKLWDNFVDASHKATFQHSRKFLNYHKDRFIDRSIIVKSSDKIIALFPAVVHPYQEKTIVSHIGATYGGLITKESIYGEELIELISLIKEFFEQHGFNRLIYKLTPSLYHDTKDEDEMYALFRSGAILTRVDINAVVDIKNRLKVSSLRKRTLKKAKKSGLTVEVGFSNVESFYDILAENLKSKHNVTPVHSIEELIELKERFDDVLELVVAKNQEGQVVSGVLFFRINKVYHAQYIASSSEGYDKGGLDMIFEDQLLEIERSGLSILAFGTSNESEGQVLNQTLYRFKRQFGAGSVAHLSYTMDL